MKISYDITTLAATKKLAISISKLAQPNLIVFLKGALGVGKTCLTKFVAAALQVKDNVSSPTFMILNQYHTTFAFNLVHIDAYRLVPATNFYEYYEYLIDNFVIIEWPEKINFNFSDQKQITITIELKNEKRIATIINHNLPQVEWTILLN